MIFPCGCGPEPGAYRAPGSMRGLFAGLRALHCGDFLAKRKEPKIRQGNSSGGKAAPLLSAFSCFSVCGPENGQSPFSALCVQQHFLGNFALRSSLPPSLLRQQEDVRSCSYPLGELGSYVVAASALRVGDQRGQAPFVKFFKLPKSNQEVFGVSLVTFFTQESHRRYGARSPIIGLPCNREGETPPQKEGTPAFCA